MSQQLSKLARKALAAAVVAGGFAAVATPQAQAALTVDLRFADGSTTMDVSSVAAGTPITVSVWAKVTGADANSLNDGLQFLFYRVLSEQVSGGAIAGDITATSLTAPWNGSSSQAGTILDRNADGIDDLGGVGALAAATDVKPRANNAIIGTSNEEGDITVPPAGYNLLPNGIEYKVSTFTFTAGALTNDADGTTKLNVALPTSNTVARANWWEETVTDATNATPPSGGIKNGASGFTAGSSVTFTAAVPEPSSLGALAIGAVGLLARRRRKA